MQIEAAGFLLRPWRAGDEPALVRHAGNRKLWLNLRDRFPHPYTAADADAWIARVAAEGEPALNFAVVVEGEPVGGAGLEPQGDVHRLTAEIGYWIAESHWGRGLATEAARRLTQYAFSRLALERLEAGVFEWNPASRRVLEKAGYRLEARLRRNVVKDGRIGDSFLYARLRGEADGRAGP